MATATKAALNSGRLNMNLCPPNDSNTTFGETNLSSQRRQQENETSCSSLDIDGNDYGESDAPSVTEAHTSQSSSTSTIATAVVAEETSSSYRDQQKVSLDKTEPIKETISSKNGDMHNLHNHQQKRKNNSKSTTAKRKSSSKGFRSWRTETTREESVDTSTCSTLLTSGSNHSEVTVSRRNASTTLVATTAAWYNNNDEAKRSTITMNGDYDNDKPTQAQHLPADNHVSNHKKNKSPSVRSRDHPSTDHDSDEQEHDDLGNCNTDVKICEEEIEVEPSSNNEDNHCEGSKRPLSFPETHSKEQKRREDDNDDDDDESSSCDIHDMCNDSSSEEGSIEILDASQPMLDSSMHFASEHRNKNSIHLSLSPSLWRSCQNTIHKMRLICGKIINQKYVQIFIVGLIIVNALVMGLGTFDFVDTNPAIRSAFDKADLAFLIVFTIESTMQLIFHGLALFKDGWLTFDFLIVILSWCFASLQVFRTMRTLRLIARLPLLRRLCQALLEAVPRLSAILCLFLLIMYIYAVMATVLFGDFYEEGVTDQDYFSRLDITFFTLFQMITLDWAKIVRQVMVVDWWASVIFSTYLSFTSFVLFSLIIGVVCDAVSATEHDADLVEALERKEDAQERILRLQQRVNYLQKQQKSVLASVQTVLDEIKVDNDPYVPGQVVPAFNSLRSSSNKPKRSSGKSAASVKSSTKSATTIKSSTTPAASLRAAVPLESSSSQGGDDADSFCGE